MNFTDMVTASNHVPDQTCWGLYWAVVTPQWPTQLVLTARVHHALWYCYLSTWWMVLLEYCMTVACNTPRSTTTMNLHLYRHQNTVSWVIILHIWSWAIDMSFEFFTNTQGWQCWHYCQFCVPIYLQFCLYLHQLVSVNVKLEIKGCIRIAF